MTKTRAFLTHLLISFLVVAAVLLVIRFQLYPDFYFAIQGISELILVLIVVDVILGPLLTLIVFKPEKKSLKFDLSVIALFQIAALVYGTYTIYDQRPLTAVMIGSSFEIQPASSYDPDKIDPDIIDPGIFSEPKFYVYATSNPEVKKAIAMHAFTGDTSFLQDMSAYFPVSEHKQRIIDSALSAEYLKKHYPGLEADTAKYYYVRLIGKSGLGLAVLDKQSYELVSVVEVTDFQMNPL